MDVDVDFMEYIGKREELGDEKMEDLGQSPAPGVTREGSDLKDLSQVKGNFSNASGGNQTQEGG